MARTLLARLQELDLPPFSRTAEVVGARDACRAFLESTQLPDGTDVFGPVDLDAQTGPAPGAPGTSAAFGGAAATGSVEP